MSIVGVMNLLFRSKKNKKTDILEKIPGVEPECALNLRRLGYNCVSELKMQDAEDMYFRLCMDDNENPDKSLLYQFRCAIYYATVREADPKKLHWWYWKDTGADDSSVSDEELIQIYENNITG